MHIRTFSLLQSYHIFHDCHLIIAAGSRYVLADCNLLRLKAPANSDTIIRMTASKSRGQGEDGL